MNQHTRPNRAFSTCPHDCPSTCALEVDLVDSNTIGRVHGARDNSYTDGVICAKVARYAERIHHPDRLLQPKVRGGSKGEGVWKSSSWEAALDLVAEKFLQAEQSYGSEAVWPYYYAGTMGLVQRDSIKRLTRAKKYSNFLGTICVTIAYTGFAAGTGRVSGVDPREMAQSDCIIVWGTNAAATQVHVMTHITKARKNRGAKLVVVDIYENATAKKADMALIIKPGTDGALACAIMHVLFRDGYADWEYLNKFTDDPKGLEAHLRTRGPAWAAEITGLSIEQIETAAKLIGTTKRSFFRLGYGFSRSRNGAQSMHAALCIPAVTGAWQYEGGGAFHTNSEIYKFDNSTVVGADLLDPEIRYLDQSKIGRILTGDPQSLNSGPVVHAMLVQNTNPANVAPEQQLVVEGLKRDDLFTCVHEQFMTDTAALADVVLPATMFLEHDDVYRGGGHQHVMLGPKVIDPPQGPRENLYVLNQLAKRLGVGELPGFDLTAREHVDLMLKNSNLPGFDEMLERKWIDVQPNFETSHFLKGFAHKDSKFHFRVDWSNPPSPSKPPANLGAMGPFGDLSTLPDFVPIIETADEQHPFRLATSPAHNLLNSTFAETPTSVAREGKPSVRIHQNDASVLGITQGDEVEIGNQRGRVVLVARLTDAQQPGVVIAEGLWPNAAHKHGVGINALVGADSVAPYGGAAFHDTRVWLRPLSN